LLCFDVRVVLLHAYASDLAADIAVFFLRGLHVFARLLVERGFVPEQTAILGLVFRAAFDGAVRRQTLVAVKQYAVYQFKTIRAVERDEGWYFGHVVPGCAGLTSPGSIPTFVL